MAGSWTKSADSFGRTETIDNTLNPDFVKKFGLDYFFEECQKLKFELYDIDCPSLRLADHDYLGKMECNLSEIVCKKTLKRKIRLEALPVPSLGTRLDDEAFRIGIGLRIGVALC
ncbi:Copine-5 [Nymphon striatum]|nr:Copine-5 [Nymphon striatum]